MRSCRSRGLSSIDLERHQWADRPIDETSRSAVDDPGAAGSRTIFSMRNDVGAGQGTLTVVYLKEQPTCDLSISSRPSSLAEAATPEQTAGRVGQPARAAAPAPAARLARAGRPRVGPPAAPAGAAAAAPGARPGAPAQEARPAQQAPGARSWTAA